MDANEYAVVDGAPLRILFLALDAKLVEVFLHFETIFLGEVTFTTSLGPPGSRSYTS